MPKADRSRFNYAASDPVTLISEADMAKMGIVPVGEDAETAADPKQPAGRAAVAAAVLARRK